MSGYNYKRYRDLLIGGGISSLLDSLSRPTKRIKVERSTSAKQRYKSAPALTKTKSKKKNRSSMYNRESGTYRGKFKKGSKSLLGRVKYPCVVRDQRQLSVTDSETAYIAHCTHPPKYMLKVMAMCLVEKYFRKCGVKIMNWLDYIPAQLQVGTPANRVGVKLFMWIQERTGTTPSARGIAVRKTLYDSAATAVSFNAMAGVILTNMVAAVDEYSNELEIVQFQWLPDAGDNQIQLITQIWDARDLFIEIKGISHLHCQNRTEGGEATAESALTTSIYANPLQGKHYCFNGTGLRIKPDFNSAGRERVNIVCDSVTGVFGIGATDSALPIAAKDALKEPPNPRYFKNVTGTSGIRLEPGSIKKSYIVSVVRKSINGWFKSYYTWLSSGVNATGTESNAGSAAGSASKYSHVYPGKGALVGMEKVCSFGVSDIVLSAERDAQYFGRIYERRSNYIPAVSDSLGTIIPNSTP